MHCGSLTLNDVLIVDATPGDLTLRDQGADGHVPPGWLPQTRVARLLPLQVFETETGARLRHGNRIVAGVRACRQGGRVGDRDFGQFLPCPLSFALSPPNCLCLCLSLSSPVVFSSLLHGKMPMYSTGVEVTPDILLCFLPSPWIAFVFFPYSPKLLKQKGTTNHPLSIQQHYEHTREVLCYSFQRNDSLLTCPLLYAVWLNKIHCLYK